MCCWNSTFSNFIGTKPKQCSYLVYSCTPTSKKLTRKVYEVIVSSSKIPTSFWVCWPVVVRHLTTESQTVFLSPVNASFSLFLCGGTTVLVGHTFFFSSRFSQALQRLCCFLNNSWMELAGDPRVWLTTSTLWGSKNGTFSLPWTAPCFLFAQQVSLESFSSAWALFVLWHQTDSRFVFYWETGQKL